MKKLIATSLIVLSLISSVNLIGFAASNNSISDSNDSTVSAVSEDYSRKQKPQLTPEQKAELDAKRKEWLAKKQNSQKKWSALTDAQKNEIYALMDKQIDIKSQMIDKYLANGVIDHATATKMKEKLAERKTQMRKSGKMPRIGK
jgi:hypothetical protein